MRRFSGGLFCVWVMFGTAQAAPNWESDGHLKYRFIVNAYPDNSFLQRTSGSHSLEQSVDVRMNGRFKLADWSGEASYQLGALHREGLNVDALQVEGGRQEDFNKLLTAGSGLANDDQRLLDLTEVNNSGNNFAVLHRLDRLNLSWQNENNVLKLGRQAISWGNGLIYTPMDILNPFDPAAIDREYKPGDDMVYAQRLFSNADDLQFAWVARRDDDGKTNGDVSTLAVKYHVVSGNNEFDFLISNHFDDTLVALGGIFAVGGSVLRGDYVYTDTGSGDFHSLVVNLSYSWQAWEHNVSGMLEYFHNDFGIAGGDYSAASLLPRQALLQRVQRGELFSLGRDYLAGSATVEMNALWLLTPNLFYNLSDNSALVQVISRHDLAQELQLIAALSVPVGPDGSEFGGINATPVSESSIADFLSTRWSVFAQLAWYF